MMVVVDKFQCHDRLAIVASTVGDGVTDVMNGCLVIVRASPLTYEQQLCDQFCLFQK